MSALDLLSQAAFLRQDDAPEPAEPTVQDTLNTHEQHEVVDSKASSIQLDPALFDAVARTGSPQQHPSPSSSSSSLATTVTSTATPLPPPQVPPLIEHVPAPPQASTSAAAAQRSFDPWRSGFNSSSHSTTHPPSALLPPDLNPPPSTLGKRSRARSNASDASDSPFANSSIGPSARKRTLSSSFPGFGAAAAVAASSSTGMQLFTDSSGQASLTSLLGGPLGGTAALPMLPPLPTLPQRIPTPPTNKLPSNKVVLPNSAAGGGTKRSKRPPSWAVNEDSGRESSICASPTLDNLHFPRMNITVIRCVCPYVADDGFTIQCDTCNVWQHAACVIISMDDVPEEYRCERCDPLGAESRGVDRSKAREGMRKRLESLENEAKNPSAAISIENPAGAGVVGGGRGRGGHLNRGGRRLSMDSSRGPSGINALLNSTAMTPSEQILDEFFGSKDALPPLPAMTKEEASKPILAAATPAAPTASTTGGGGWRGKPRRSGGSVHSIAPTPAGASTTTDALMGSYESSAAASTNDRASAPGGPSTSRPPRGAVVAASSAALSIPNTPGPVPHHATGRKRRQMKQPALSNSASGTPMGSSTRGPRASAGSIPNVSAPPTPGVLSGPNGGYLGEPFSYVDGSSIVTPRPSTANGPKTPAAGSDDEDFLSSTGGKGEENRYEGWRYEYTPIERDLIRDNALVQRLQEIVALDVTMMDGSEELETVSDELRPQLELLRERQETSRPRHGANSKDSLVPLLYDPTPFVVLDELPDPSSVAVKVLPPSSFHLNPPAVAAYATASSQTPTCPYPRPTMHGLFAVNAISSGSFIAPIRGQIVSLDQYRSDPINQYDTLGVPKQGVRCLPYPWSLAIDSRMFGNEVRFARSGCHPNAVVQAIKIVPAPNPGGPTQPSSPSVTTTNGDLKAGVEEAAAPNGMGRSTRASTPWTDQRRCSELSTTLIFGVFATADIGRREEIVLPWDWDDSHIVHALSPLMSAPPLPPGLNERDLEPLSRKMVQVTNTILGTTHCACEKKRDCALHWMCRGAAASLPLSKAALAKPREPFAMILLNALGSGQAFQQQPDGKFGAAGAGGARSGASAAGGDVVVGPGKPGRRMKKPDVGPLLGLVRGWIVRSAQDPITNRHGRASSNKNSISDFPPPPPMPQSLTVYENEERDNQVDGSRASLEASSELTPESDLENGVDSDSSASGSDVKMQNAEEEEEYDEERGDDSFVTAHNRMMDIDISPGTSKANITRKATPLDGDLTDDSDLTEPLSNLSSDESNDDLDDGQEEEEEEEEEENSIRAPSRKTKVTHESSPAKPEKRRPGKKRADKQETGDKREAKKGVDKASKLNRISSKEVDLKASTPKDVERKRKDEIRNKKDKKLGRPLSPSFPEEAQSKGKSAKALEALPLFDQHVEFYSARDAPMPTEQSQPPRVPPPPPPPPRWSGTSEAPDTAMQVDPVKEATPPSPPQEPTPPHKEPNPPPPVPRARLSLAAYRQRLAQKQTEPTVPAENSASTPSTTTVSLVASPVEETVPLLPPAVVTRPFSETGATVNLAEEGELNEVSATSSVPGVPAVVAAAFSFMRRSSGTGEEPEPPTATTSLPPPPPAPYPASGSEPPIPNAHTAVVYSPPLPTSEPSVAPVASAPASRPSFNSAEDILKSIGDYFSKPTAPASGFASRSLAPVIQQSLPQVASASPSPPPPPPTPLAVLPSPPAPPAPYVSPPRRSPTPERATLNWRTSFATASAVDSPSSVVAPSGGIAMGFDTPTPSSSKTPRLSRFDAPSTTTTTSRWGAAMASSSTPAPPPPPPPPPPLPSHRPGPSISTGPLSPSLPPPRSPSTSSSFPLSSREAPSSSRPAPPTRPFDLDSVPTGPRAMTQSGGGSGGSAHPRGWSVSPAAREVPLHPPPGTSERRVNFPTWAATSNSSSADSGTHYGGYMGSRGGYNSGRGGSRGRGAPGWVTRGMRGRGRGKD
ncbi:BQ2448_5234 [Microbotryum intermedium]|uniref:BQ2448_5234 protein n=1 Tax=Microbotryum intermedium TaxID=269621 RepID=A0A238F6K3_9BASI|nr:BQ2448_5234 [Microbotryum intermedium]